MGRFSNDKTRRDSLRHPGSKYESLLNMLQTSGKAHFIKFLVVFSGCNHTDTNIHLRLAYNSEVIISGLIECISKGALVY